MNDKMEIDSDVLRSTAGKVEASSSELNDGIQRFRSVIEQLSTTWSSEVKNRFFKSYEKDFAALTEMADQYAEVAGGLYETAEDMDRHEDEINAAVNKAGKAVG